MLDLIGAYCNIQARRYASVDKENEMEKVQSIGKKYFLLAAPNFRTIEHWMLHSEEPLLQTFCHTVCERRLQLAY